MQEVRVQSLSRKDLLELDLATHSSILAWKTPWGCKASDTTEHTYSAQVTINLIKAVRRTTPTANSNVNDGLWVTMMYCCRLISCMGGLFIRGEALHLWGQRIYGKSLCLLFKFAVNLKLLWRSKLFFFFFKFVVGEGNPRRREWETSPWLFL